MTGYDGMRNQAAAQPFGVVPRGTGTQERHEACLLGRAWGWYRSNGRRKLRNLRPLPCGNRHALLLLGLADGGSGGGEDA